MESSSIVQELPLGQDPRPGQARVLTEIAKGVRDSLSIKLPTGYGKTFTAYTSYHLLKRMGRVNRVLFILPTSAQLNQLVDNSERDYAAAGLTGMKQVVDIRFFGTQALKQHRKNTHQVFAITVQSLIEKRGLDTVCDLMQSGRWMVVVDEYHHYGLGKRWGDVVNSLPSTFQLAMSATPYRPAEDGAFGDPDLSVTYREAVDEHAVKPLRGHGYIYRIDAVDRDGNVISYTTSQLAAEAGGDAPEAVERLRVDKKMRWSPKYISPLVSHPLERMLSDRNQTGRNLRAIVGAMCVSHAELICAQVASMFPELKADWVGTGPDGREDDVNKGIIERFLADPFDNQGNRNDVVDVLVHVGMAGEGLDSRLVSEVIHLNRASFNNSNNQENGRAARYLEDINGNAIVGNINFDSSSDYSVYTGSKIELAMDDVAPTVHEDEPGEEVGRDEYRELPDEPAIEIKNCELEDIDHGSVEVKRMAGALKQLVSEFKLADIDDPELTSAAARVYMNMRHEQAQQFNERSSLAQWGDAVNAAMSTVTGLVIRKVSGSARVDRSFAGDIKKRIYQRKKRNLGVMNKAEETSMRQHYNWIKSLEREILDGGLPEWLA